MKNISEKCDELWNKSLSYKQILVFIIIVWSLGYFVLVIVPFNWKNINSFAYEDAYINKDNPFTNHNSDVLVCNNKSVIYLKFSFDRVERSIIDMLLIIPNCSYKDMGYFYMNMDIYLVQNSWNEKTLTADNAPDHILKLHSYYDENYNTDAIDISAYLQNTDTLSFKIEVHKNSNLNINFTSHEVIDKEWFPTIENRIYINITYVGFAINDILPISIFTLVMVFFTLVHIRNAKKDGVMYSYYCE